MRLSIKLAALATAVVATATASGSVAMAADNAADPATSIVEDFSYPGRDQILADKGIKLNSGDGHILLVDCTVAGDKIMVETYEHDENVCFQLTGAHGYLSLEIGRTVYVYSENKPVEATVQLAGEAEPSDPQTVPANHWTQFGEAANLPSATLLEIRA